MIKKITFFFAAMAFSIFSNAQSFSALYSFDNITTTSGLTDPTPVPTATGVVFGNFSATGTPANPNAAGRFSFTNWPLGATTAVDLYTSLTGSINPAQYYEVTVTPDVNYTLDLTSITFVSRRSATSIRTYAVRSNTDAYAANLPASIAPANVNLSVQTGDVFFWNFDATSTSVNQSGNTITLSGSSYTALATPVTFRFYAWNAEATGGSFGIDTVRINGTATLGTSINTKTSEIQTSIYPNPSANGMFTVDLNNSSNKTNVTVYNIIGKIVLEKEINSIGKQQIDLSNQANGSYFVTFKNDNSTVTRKITINK